MRIKQLFLGAATVCMLCAAAMMMQSMLASSAIANPGIGGGNLLSRVRALERRQDQDDKDFQMVDLSLDMLEMEVEIARARAREAGNNLQQLRAELNRLGIPVNK